jgi:hypothetical protein
MAKKLGAICAGLRGGPTSPTIAGGPRETIEARERKLIIAAVRKGGTAEEIALTFARSSKAVRKIAREENLTLGRAGRQARHDLILRLPRAALDMLADAARRRRQTIEAVASNVVLGSLMRACLEHPPSMDQALRLAAKYEVEKNA